MRNEHANYSRGLTAIPPRVQQALSQGTLTKLKVDGHGLSFPENTHCQLRVRRNNENKGGTYSYKEWGTIQKAVDAAMSRCVQLRAASEKERVVEITAKDGVSYYERHCKRDNATRCGYRVSYINAAGKPAGRTFQIGETATADRQFHAFRTAKAFRAESGAAGTDGFDPTLYDDWRTTRMYTLSREAFDWDATAAEAVTD